MPPQGPHGSLEKDNDDSGTVNARDTHHVDADRSQQVGAERQISSSNVREDINAGESLAALVSRDSGAQATWAHVILAEHLARSNAHASQQMRHSEELHAQKMRQQDVLFQETARGAQNSGTSDSFSHEASTANNKNENTRRSNQDGNVADRLTNINEDSAAAVQLASVTTQMQGILSDLVKALSSLSPAKG